MNTADKGRTTAARFNRSCITCPKCSRKVGMRESGKILPHETTFDSGVACEASEKFLRDLT